MSSGANPPAAELEFRGALKAPLDLAGDRGLGRAVQIAAVAQAAQGLLNRADRRIRREHPHAVGRLDAEPPQRHHRAGPEDRAQRCAARQELALGVGQRADSRLRRLVRGHGHGFARDPFEVDHPAARAGLALDGQDPVLPVDAQQLLEQRRIAARLGDRAVDERRHQLVVAQHRAHQRCHLPARRAPRRRGAHDAPRCPSSAAARTARAARWRRSAARPRSAPPTSACRRSSERSSARSRSSSTIASGAAAQSRSSTRASTAIARSSRRGARRASSPASGLSGSSRPIRLPSSADISATRRSPNTCCRWSRTSRDAWLRLGILQPQSLAAPAPRPRRTGQRPP